MVCVNPNRLIVLITLLIMPCVLQAAYFQTLPKNVRLVAVKEVFAMGIDSYYGPDMKSGPYQIKAQIDSKVLENVEGLGEFYFEKLKQYVPEAYNKFNAGSWEVKATSDAKVFGMGAAYGITERLTAYASVPYYNVKINLEATRTSDNNYAEVNRIIQQNQQNLHGAGIVINTDSLPDTNSELLQSVLVNYYGYAPAGTWEGKGYGDIELALKYRLTDWQDSGLALTSGAIVPTGRVESEDIFHWTHRMVMSA